MLKQIRRIATRYDKTTLSFISFLNIATKRLGSEHFVNTTRCLKIRENLLYLAWLRITIIYFLFNYIIVVLI